ncbi:hypothetical protein E0H82_01225 [Acinetobacter sp. ANC 4910]|uniref:hypothetical protein n=1 Tax=Acinetobacter sp. ANC 4910 TaxID=2529850 RepID=UPI00103C997C|nr:hypothetical protein [Acinetobacter sp. ANC 4910]TCB38246.1 hypothetical protein E0H82_01225 [Acinetobacter sp. ANC 4910]
MNNPDNNAKPPSTPATVIPINSHPSRQKQSDPLYASRTLPDGRVIHGAAAFNNLVKEQGGPTQMITTIAKNAAEVALGDFIEKATTPDQKSG